MLEILLDIAAKFSFFGVARSPVTVKVSPDGDTLTIRFISEPDEEKYYKLFRGTNGAFTKAQHGITGELADLSTEDQIVASELEEYLPR